MLRVRHVIGYSMIVRNDAMTGECRQGDPQLGSCVPAGGASECGRYGVCCRWIVGDRILGLSPQNLVAMALSLTTNALVPLGSSAEALTRRLRPVFQSVRRRPAAHRPSVLINFTVKEAADRAGVSPAASIHGLRHTRASHAIDNGAPVTLVSATLGHADLQTTSSMHLLYLGWLRPVFEDVVLGTWVSPYARPDIERLAPGMWQQREPGQ